MDFTLNFYTAFYLLLGQNPANVFTNFGQIFTHIFTTAIFLNTFKAYLMKQNRLLHTKWAAMRLGTGLNDLNIVLV